MILDIIEKIAATSSRNEKEAILRDNKDNKLLKEVIRLAYDPFINFYQRKIPKYKPVEPAWNAQELSWALASLSSLSDRTYTGNKAIEYLTGILENLHEPDATIIERIIGKDLRMGCTSNTASKIWPDLKFEWPVMLCSVFEQKLVDKITFPAFFQLKADGARVNIIVENNEVKYYSRAGQSLDLYGIIDKEFLLLAGSQDTVFDGELLVTDDTGAELDRKTGNGILTKAQRGTLSPKQASYIISVLWDFIPLKEFRTGKWEVPYKYRWASLLERFGLFELKKISLIPTSMVNSLAEATTMFQDFLTQGKEGGILKDPTGVWENKRSRSQIKFKGELETDLVVVDWVRGTGKYAGMMGALILESSDAKIRVSVGSGFNDSQRASIDRDIIGKIVTIKYNARITKKDGGPDSLFLPIIIQCPRLDKDIADSSEEIK